MPPTSWNDLTDEQLRDTAHRYTSAPDVDDMSREDLVAELDEEGVVPSETLISDPAPALPPMSSSSDLGRRRSAGPPAPDLSGIDPVTAGGILPQSAMPANPGDSYPDRG